MTIHNRDNAVARCPSKIARTRGNAITEALRLGYPVAPYKCPNGKDHWHIGNSRRNARLFHNAHEQWEKKLQNQDNPSHTL